jgi:hypothetical protein
MGRPDPAAVAGGANGRAGGEERLGCYGQRRFGGRCLLSARPMIAAFSSWLSSRLDRLRFGTIGNMPGWGLAGCRWRRIVTLVGEGRGRS